MATTIGNAGVTFPDATVQSTRAVASVSAGTGISSSGGITPTITNTGVTSAVAGTGISVSGATGAVTFTNTGVTSIAGGTTGLTPAGATTGAVTLAGTLARANGGTGLTVAGTSGNVLTSNGTDWVSQAPSGGGVVPIGSVGSVVYGAANTPDVSAFTSFNTTVSGATLNSPPNPFGAGMPGAIGLSGLVGTWLCVGAFSIYQACPISSNYFKTGVFQRIA